MSGSRTAASIAARRHVTHLHPKTKVFKAQQDPSSSPLPRSLESNTFCQQTVGFGWVGGLLSYCAVNFWKKATFEVLSELGILSPFVKKIEKYYQNNTPKFSKQRPV